MKKSLVLFLFLFALFILPLQFHSQGYQIAINSEWAKVYNTEGGYRSWTISYSHGRTWNKNKEMINLWKWPSFHHCDVRPLLENGEYK